MKSVQQDFAHPAHISRIREEPSVARASSEKKSVFVMDVSLNNPFTPRAFFTCRRILECRAVTIARGQALEVERGSQMSLE